MGPVRILWLLVACTLAVHSRGLPSEHPVVHLRNALIHTGQQAQAASSRGTGARRSVQEHAYHTRSERWGALRDAAQFILTHRSDLGHAERVALLGQLRQRGAHVAGYVPDSSLLVVGPAQLETEAATWPGVVWVGQHEPEYKVAPEWQQILAQLEGMPALGSGANATTEGQRQAQVAALSRLPALVEFSAEGQPRVGIQVSMPRGEVTSGLYSKVSPGSVSSNSSNTLQGMQQQQEEAEEGQQQHAGEAAAADWAAALDALCDEGVVSVRPAGRSGALVLSPPQCLEAVLEWLSHRPAVHWLAPAPRLRLRNSQASSIIQSAKPNSPWAASSNTDASIHPLWAAGITGAGQVIGCGDSGVDRNHCFFSDPAIDDNAWRAKMTYQGRVKTFVCPECRKIIYYRAYGDEYDSNGHGTHVAGTLLGFPAGAASLSSPGTQYIGMAPSAKLAFVDLGDGTSDLIYTPGDLQGGYFDFTTSAGAKIHSDSWGSSSINYDDSAAQVDEYCWKNKDFLPVFAAGNEGDMLNKQGDSGASTVTSPATAKNCITAGGTQSSGESTTGSKYTIYDATVDQGGNLKTTFRVLQAGFGKDISTLGSAAYPLVVAEPLLGCAPLQNSVAGAVVLMQRGDCNFAQKAAYAQAAGAKAALVYDNVMGSYFVLAPDNRVSSTVTIPTMSITRRLGQQLFDSLSIGRNLSMAFSPASAPSAAYSFENLASYSSQGPTKDNRIKPDLVAPGTLTSAGAGEASPTGNECGYARMQGTSMATPVIAGAAALVRQYFTDGYYPSSAKNDADKRTPSSALVKAVMIGGASSIQGVEADTGLPIDPPPSFRQGFGRVNLGASVQLAGGSTKLQVVDETGGINTGEAHEYCIRATGAGPMKITLVWTDYPGSPAARKALVNDLDLTVRAEGYNGRPLFGNGGSVTDSSSPDRENNVEQVPLDDLPEGRVSIEIKGYSVYAAAGPQPYALVVTGAFTGELTRTGAGGSGDCLLIKSGPSGVTNRPATFEFGTQAGNTKGVSFECQLTDAQGAVGASGTHDWKDCTSPAAYPRLPDGSYQFSVRAKGEKIASSQTFKLDTTPPVLALASKPDSSSSADTATVEFSADDTSPVSFSCKLTASGTSPLQKGVYYGTVNSAPLALGQPYNCTSPQTFHWLLPGQWAFEVVGTDAAGNAAAPTTYAWTVAFAAGKKYTRLYSGPFRLVPGIPASFEFGVLQLGSGGAASMASVDGAATVCWLEKVTGGAAAAADWQSCTSPKSYGKLDDGQYRFHVRADPSAPDTDAVSAFTIDSTPPATTITSSPKPIHTSSTAELKFESNEEGSTFQCRLVNEDDPSAGSAAYQPCTSPQQYSNLTDGQYDFSARATDLVGNVGAPANASFLLDTTPPRWTSIQYPVATREKSITVTFEVNDGPRSVVQNITCRFRPLQLVSGAATAAQSEWVPCTSPQTYTNLLEGHYGLTLRATDQAGLVNQTGELDIWIDATQPVVKFASGPAKGGTSGSSVTFVLEEDTQAAPGTGSNITAYTTLLQSISEAQYKGINNGSITSLNDPGTGSGGSGNVIKSWRQGAAGDTSTSSSSSSSGSGGSDPAADSSSARLLDNGSASGGSSGGSTLDAQSVLGVPTNASSPLTYTGLKTGYYALQARATDLAGNTGPDSQPYAFYVEVSSSSKSIIWIVVGAAGGVALLVAVVFLVIWMRKRKRPVNPPAPVAAVPPCPPAANGYSNGYANGGGYSNGAAYPVSGSAAGAWGYSAPYGGYSNGTAPPAANPLNDPIYQQQLALDAAAARRQGAAPAALPPPPPPVFNDALYEQQVAYALAASQRPQQVAVPVPPPAAPVDEDEELRRAIQASLQEQRRQSKPAAPAPEEDDPEMRAAIEASLREQQRYAELSPWAGSPQQQQGAGGSSSRRWDSLI